MPGCSAAVGNEGAVVWQGVRGVAVVEPTTPLTADTTFDIGSVSKQFTALAVALLAEEGRLSLYETVADHLDRYPAWAGQMTLSELIHHTSGIPDYTLAAGFTKELLEHRDRRWTTAEVLPSTANGLRTLPPSAPGTRSGGHRTPRAHRTPGSIRPSRGCRTRPGTRWAASTTASPTSGGPTC